MSLGSFVKINNFSKILHSIFQRYEKPAFA